MTFLSSFAPWLGWIGGAILVLGSAWPEHAKEKATKSIKNWLFVVGTVGLLLYSIFNYMLGGSIFYVFLEGLAVVASVLMMLELKDKTDSLILGPLAGILVVISWVMGEGIETTLFILGLLGIGLGYALTPMSAKRQGALFLGSVLIAWFSYLQSNAVFLWLNVFFAVFSLYYLGKVWKKD